MTTVTPAARRSRRTPEQMIADLQAELAKVKARAELQAAAPPATPARARRRRSKQLTSPLIVAAPTPLISTLRAEIQACVDAFSVDLVDLIQRSTLDAVQSVLGRIGNADSAGDATGNEPRFMLTSLRTPTWSANALAAKSSAAKSNATVTLPKSNAVSATAPLSFKAYERMAIERALAERGGNAIEAGRLLGLTRSSVYRRIKAHGIQTSAQGGHPEVSPHDPVARSGEPASLDGYERAAIQRAIDQGGDIVAAAKLLRAGRSTLYRRIEALGIPRRPQARRYT